MNFSTLVEDRSRRFYQVVFLGFLALSLIPILSNPRLPLHDYPNHVARMVVLAHPEAFTDSYRVEWRAYPNLAMEAIVMPLQAIVGVPVACKIFEVLLVLISFLGAHFLGRELHGRSTFLAPLTSYFLFSLFMLYGFVNYLFGIGLFYVAFAIWLRAWRSDGKIWLAVSFVTPVLCYLAHLSSYAFLAAAVGIWTLLHFREAGFKKAALYLLPLIPPVILKLTAAVPALPGTEWDGPFAKIKGAASLVLGYHWAIDGALFALLIAGVVLGLRQSSEKSDRSSLIIAGALFAAFLLAPSESMGSWALDRRFLIPSAVLALLSIRFAGPRALAAWTMIAVAAAAHLILIAIVWHGLSAKVARNVELIDQSVAPRSRLAGFIFLETKNKQRWPWQMPYRWMVHWSVLDREAAARGLFAYEGQQPIREVSSPKIDVWPEAATPPEKVSWPAIFHAYDAFFGFQLTAPYREFLQAHCQVAGTRDDAIVYRSCAME